ncbi:general stress protein 69 [Ruminiclostridium hungatei]|uniref:General stress protein 69 n=1 Tax=Ruminiclostridium hungatei TaxID=48256 RepID=A0A1V4SKU6_RUMHU|nr:aldo/keto reductase [Ruminiclostridium hungatei]OPX44413.1 general stress protein 69 [Ruminiclostridium hungatei]
MEKRKFGRTGLETSILGFGGFHLLEIPLSEAKCLLNRYLDAGGNYIETAAGYGDGESERKIGQSVAHRRKEFVLATKTAERTKVKCLESLDRSLANLRTDYIDLFIMHAVGTMEELDTILGAEGALEGALQAKQEGKIKHIGISMHGQPHVLIRALKEYDFDAVMTTINYYDRFNFPEIEEELIPLALNKQTAIILMKPIGDGLLWKSVQPAFRYAFTQPASVIVAGINNREMLELDLEFAGKFVPMSEVEMERLYAEAPELGSYVCRQCGKCCCPEGIPLQEIFKYEGYFDRQMADGVITNAAEYSLKERLRFWFGNSKLAMDRYKALDIKADKCTKCGRCMPDCPYGIDIIRKLSIADYKLAAKDIY